MDKGLFLLSHKMWLVILAVIAICFSGLAHAGNLQLTKASLVGKGQDLHVLFRLSGKTNYKVFSLKSPHRVVVDIPRTKLKGPLSSKQERLPLKRIRYAERSEGFLRVVLDMDRAVKVHHSLKKISKRDYELVVSIQPKSGDTFIATKSAKSHAKVVKTSVKKSAAKSVRTKAPTNSVKSGNTFVVAIDPGHGGKDPGAIGRAGTKEKTVVLSVAKRLANRINAVPGMKAILTRTGDHFVPLRKRIETAREHNVDIFISIHADAHTKSSARGSSVYILSENGASSEAARLLAKKENDAYEVKVGDVHLTGRNSKVASILLSLSQDETLDRSLALANNLLKTITPVSNPLRKRVESAGFVVLKAPDVPSVLVETAFLSNPTEEKRLVSSRYQQRLADALFEGVRNYQRAYAPSSFHRYTKKKKPTQLASNAKIYTVRHGDSLTGIANKHGLTVRRLRSANRLNTTVIHVGQKLTLPK